MTTYNDYITIDDTTSRSLRITALARFDRMFALGTYKPVVSKYNGRPGCGCGCNGTYVENPDAVTVRRTAKIIRRHLEEGTGEVMFGPDGTTFVWAETENTVNALYWY